MDQLAVLGTTLQEGIGPTLQIYQPMLDRNADAILSTNKETYSYGSDPRQALDVYYPTAEHISPAPILIFFYGGGLIRGSRNLPFVKKGLVYSNLGHFFSSLGYITIIPDYRLVPEAKFPSGGEDVLAVLEWTGAQFADNDRDIFLMGHSAGGIHVSTFVLANSFASKLSSFIRGVGGLRGVILLSVPFSFHEAHETRNETLQKYFGSDIERNCPTGLLKTAKQSSATLPIPLLITTCTLDPIDEIINPVREFTELCKYFRNPTPDDEGVKSVVIEGHNHVSPMFALGTAVQKGEAWGFEVHGWMRSVSARK